MISLSSGITITIIDKRIERAKENVLKQTLGIFANFFKSRHYQCYQLEKFALTVQLIFVGATDYYSFLCI